MIKDLTVIIIHKNKLVKSASQTFFTAGCWIMRSAKMT
ncbi:Uncharacterised protein [Vibrio cholerae]|nr:Uncharacterised protein [Vibrio cholerae]